MPKYYVESGEMRRVVTGRTARAAAVRAVKAEIADEGRPLGVLIAITEIPADAVVYTAAAAVCREAGVLFEKGGS